MLDPLISRTLGRYLIQAEIGRGGMARVYRALDTVLQRPVALKVLQPSLSADPEFSRRFEREAVTAANVRHPAIVTIYDVGEADQLRYIAMEYIAGRTLMEVLQERGRLGLPLTIAVLEPVAQALDYAHQQGMVHRDIKPHNIMVDIDGRVLLTDFGIAIGQNEPGERLTRTGVFMGTPEYISPEQAQSQPLTGHSDLYSLAVVAYEMLSGQVPFGGGTAQQIMAHAYHAPPPFTTMDSTQPPELNDVFNRALAKDPNHRFVSASTLVDALRGIARRYGMAPAPRDAIAELAQPRGGSAGQATVLLGKPERDNRAVPPPMVPALAAPVVPFAQGANDAAYGASPVPASRGANNPPVGAIPRGGVGRAGGGDRLPPGARLPARPADDEGGGRLPWALLAIAAIAIALVIFALTQLFGAGGPLNSPSDPNAAATIPVPGLSEIDFTPGPLPTGTQTPEVLPTAIRTATPTNTTVPTDTPVPTNTSVPTGTSVPPTSTPVPTDTPVPSTPTDTPTATPSASPLPSVPPTVPPISPPPTPTETSTPPPTPTETPTLTPPPTETPTQAPTNTATTTPVVAGTPPTVTATATATATADETVTTTETETTTETATASPRSAAFALPAALAADTTNTTTLDEQIAVLSTNQPMIYTAHIPIMLPHTAASTPTRQAHAVQPHATPARATATTRSRRAFLAR